MNPVAFETEAGLEEIADLITAEASDEYTAQLKKAIEDQNRVPEMEDNLRFHETGYKVRFNFFFVHFPSLP